MKMRTSYLKVADMNDALKFWESLLGTKAHKRSEYWSEIKCSNINFGLLWTEDFRVDRDKSNFVPVFEVLAADLDTLKIKAVELGASIVVDLKDHPDKKSYVLADPMGNEFEITRFHD